MNTGKRLVFSCVSFFSVAVMLISSMAATASAVMYFLPSEEFPSMDELPFGYNSVVVDITCTGTTVNNVGFWRFFVPYGTVFQCQKVTNQNKYTITFIFSNQYSMASTNTFYVQAYGINEPISGGLSTLHSVYNSSLDAEYYETTTDVVYSRLFGFYSNYSAYSDNSSYLPSTFKAYPSANTRVVSEINSNVDNRITELNSLEQSRHIAEVTQASQNHADDMSQRSQQHQEDISQRSAEHSEIMNAGQNEPTLDTDNNWMDDSLSKVNGWLDDLSNFDAQMSDNRAQNADNMSKAQQFLSSFFGSVPAAVIAAMALCLVVIVVVKIVGR